MLTGHSMKLRKNSFWIKNTYNQLWCRAGTNFVSLEESLSSVPNSQEIPTPGDFGLLVSGSRFMSFVCIIQLTESHFLQCGCLEIWLVPLMSVPRTTCGHIVIMNAMRKSEKLRKSTPVRRFRTMEWSQGWVEVHQKST